MLAETLVILTTYKYPVFSAAVVETIVFVLRHSRPQNNIVSIVSIDNRSHEVDKKTMPQDSYQSTHNNAFLVTADAAALKLREKIEDHHPTLAHVANINQAIALKYDRSASIFQKRDGPNFKRVLDGRNINRYVLNWAGEYLAYDVDRIHSCKRTDIFEAKEKLFFRRVGDRLIATYDTKQFYALNTLVVITWKNKSAADLRYLLGLINSRLLNYYYVTFLKSTKKVFSEIQARQLGQLPICLPAESTKKPKEYHNRLVKFVSSMLELNSALSKAKTAHERTVIERQIEATDREIDRLVYELYGLSDEEIALVEGAT
jgi:hypothetical protein